MAWAVENALNTFRKLGELIKKRLGLINKRLGLPKIFKKKLDIEEDLSKMSIGLP